MWIKWICTTHWTLILIWSLPLLSIGWQDVSLVSEGRAEAAAAGRLLKKHGITFDVVYTRYSSASWFTHSLTLFSIPLTPSETSRSFRLLFTLFFSNLFNPSDSSLFISLTHSLSLSLSLSHSLSLSLSLPTSVCSWLSRAIETAWLVLDELDLLWLPIIKTWRLNERYCSSKYMALPVFTHRGTKDE